MSTEVEQMNPPAWHQQSLPIPSWLVLAALAFVGPADTVAGSMLQSSDYQRLALQVETLSAQVETLSAQVDELRDTDGDVARVLDRVVQALDERAD